MYTYFFQLLRIALGRGESLAAAPTKDEWTEMFASVQKQTLVGVFFYWSGALAC